MKRGLEPIDLIVAVGVFATLLGGFFLFMATSGTLEAATPQPVTMSPDRDIMEAMQFVQPALGQAIVDDYLLGRRVSSDIASAVLELNRAAMVAHGLQTPAFGYLGRIATHASRAKADHAARIQFVLGQMIVSFTTRGLRSGILSPADPSGVYNRRMIDVADATGSKMDEEFRKNWQTSLGQAIVTATQWHHHLMGRVQERLGNGIVRVALVQDGYRDASVALQEQLGSVAVAAIHTEFVADRFAQLAAADPLTRKPPIPFVAPRSWPEIPVGVLVTAFLALIGIFCAGCSMPVTRLESEAMAESRPEPAEAGYRKTA